MEEVNDSIKLRINLNEKYNLRLRLHMNCDMKGERLIKNLTIIASISGMIETIDIIYQDFEPMALLIMYYLPQSINQSINKLYLPSNLQCSTQVLISSSQLH